MCTFDPDTVAKYSLSSKRTAIKGCGIRLGITFFLIGNDYFSVRVRTISDRPVNFLNFAVSSTANNEPHS